ncbi:putative membrane protein [Lyngbya aestuarii BL J]|uniref:Putative membrane protein n=1 Tax=Lyngbya aestuarii BL J TaxID=1348334 RepID=U7QI78_9CYAN|nr:putative membrane protein [Lyngbya aestuarii BL J]
MQDSKAVFLNLGCILAVELMILFYIPMEIGSSNPDLLH